MENLRSHVERIDRLGALVVFPVRRVSLLAGIFSLLLSACGQYSPVSKLKIVNGIDATSELDSPVVKLWFDGSKRCSGVFLNAKVILTAAHCVQKNMGYSSKRYRKITAEVPKKYILSQPKGSQTDVAIVDVYVMNAVGDFLSQKHKYVNPSDLKIVKNAKLSDESNEQYLLWLQHYKARYDVALLKIDPSWTLQFPFYPTINPEGGGLGEKIHFLGFGHTEHFDPGAAKPKTLLTGEKKRGTNFIESLHEESFAVVGSTKKNPRQLSQSLPSLGDSGGPAISDDRLSVLGIYSNYFGLHSEFPDHKQTRAYFHRLQKDFFHHAAKAMDIGYIKGLGWDQRFQLGNVVGSFWSLSQSEFEKGELLPGREIFHLNKDHFFYRAGLREGDVIRRIASQLIYTAEDIEQAIVMSSTKMILVEYRRNNRHHKLSVVFP